MSLLLCPTRRMLGIPCPACGLTRSVAALARGEARESIRYHPLGIPVALAVIVGLLCYPLRYSRPVAASLARLDENPELLKRLLVLGIFGLWLARLPNRATRARLAPEPGLLRLFH